MKIKADGYLQLYVKTEFDLDGPVADEYELKNIVAGKLKEQARLEHGIPVHHCDLEIWNISEG